MSLELKKALSPDTIKLLQDKGHNVVTKAPNGTYSNYSSWWFWVLWLFWPKKSWWQNIRFLNCSLKQNVSDATHVFYLTKYIKIVFAISSLNLNNFIPLYHFSPISHFDRIPPTVTKIFIIFPCTTFFGFGFNGLLTNDAWGKWRGGLANIPRFLHKAIDNPTC